MTIVASRWLRLSAVAALLVALAAVPAPVARAQEPESDLIVEDLPREGESEIEVWNLPDHAREDLELLLRRAAELSRTDRHEEAVSALAGPVELLRDAAGDAPAAWGALLARSLVQRAAALAALGADREADADLREAVTAAPGYEPEADAVPSELRRRLRELRDTLTATLSLQVDPADALVLVDGVPVPALATGEAVRLLAGRRTVEVRRPGYATFAAEAELRAGRNESLEAILERTSATVTVTTSLPGAEVIVDGRPAGTTASVAPSGAREGGNAGDLDEAPVGAGVLGFDDDLGAPGVLVVAGLGLGEHTIEVRKEGFRPQSGSLRVGELGDHRVGPLLLERTRGTVVLSRLPAGAEVRVDGRVVPTEASPGAGVSIELPVGSHRLLVDAGRLGAYDASFELVDRQTVDLEVALRPKLCLLDVLGGDSRAASRLSAALAAAFGDGSEWRFADRGDDAGLLLDLLGGDPGRWRSAARAGSAAGLADWAEVQRRADASLGCSVYALGVLSDDVYASDADLWTWAAAPGPRRPSPVRLRLDDGAAVEALAARFAERPPLTAPWLGAELLAAPGDEGSVVRSVTPGGPAAAAGLLPGDLLVEPRDPWVSIPGRQRLIVRRPDVHLETSIELGTGPRALEPAEIGPHGLLGAPAAAWLALAEEEGSAPAWLVALDRAAIHLSLGDGEAAVRALRGTDAPDRPGLGRAAVDYWLGVALLAANPSAPSDEVRTALDRAARDPDGRLRHDDGTAVAPRARVRLRALDPG